MLPFRLWLMKHWWVKSGERQTTPRTPKKMAKTLSLLFLGFPFSFSCFLPPFSSNFFVVFKKQSSGYSSDVRRSFFTQVTQFREWSIRWPLQRSGFMKSINVVSIHVFNRQKLYCSEMLFSADSIRLLFINEVNEFNINYY